MQIMNKKVNLQKIKVLGQEYLIRSSDYSNMQEVANYVNSKMNEVIESGVDKDSQQLRIAIFACLEIAGEFFLHKEKESKIINKIQNNSQSIIKQIDAKLADLAKE